jgi:CheY-like chemotaxis protein
LTSVGNLLELACSRIADLEVPAYVKDNELRYVAVNEAYARFFGGEISDFIGRRTREIFDRPEVEEREDKERRALVFGTEENALCFDAAGTAYVRIQIESFMPSEERGYVLGLFADNGRRLEQREDELQRLLERAEVAKRAKPEFLGYMSHELRRPANEMLGVAGLLAKTDLDPRQRAFVDSIVKSGNALLKIISEIPEVSKIDADPEPLPIDMRGARVLVVDGNAVNHRMLCEQLALWGFDGAAAEDGRTAVAILEAAHDLRVGVDVLVLDYQMPGINGAEIARILMADARFDNLPIIFLSALNSSDAEKEFAELNRHAHLVKPVPANILRSTIIEVVRASRLKRGSAAETVVGPESGLETSGQEHAAPPLGKSSTSPFIDVLVAEDNEVSRIVFTQILQGTGLNFMVVNNGQEAVDAWQTHSPRIIMTDVSMPVMNGYDATRLIRERERGQGHRVPIIGVTAHALEADRERCLAAGMDDYLSKPISPELLDEKIELWLGKSAERRELKA